MEKNTLGKRIKEARLAKKMTQSEVVGNFITRNMLSQIESGSATPSVKTLEYLCKVLEIEPNTLLPDENDSKNAPDAEGYISIRTEFINKNYKAVIEYDAEDEFSDEIFALKAKACLAAAGEYSGSDSAAELQKAVDLAKQASEFSQRGIFADESVKSKADELLKASAKRLSDYYRSLL